jgi:hypothetical protein
MSISRRVFVSALACAPLARPEWVKPRRKRSEAFFGLHFDLHPEPEDPALGRDVTEEMVEKLLAAVQPDSVQYDSKGHVGWLGWPDSKIGPSAPHIVKDSLAIWRKVTARHGVALCIHFSGVWDFQQVERHPDWARLDAKGKTDGRNTSTFGPYVNEIMIPQLREAATRYDLDGVWVDGDCWAVQPDYSPRALAAWKKATGYDQAPASSKEPHWFEWLDFNREQFRLYVRHYVDAMHTSQPHFQVASNWLYSSMVPEKPEIPVDFLSGDYPANSAIENARREARFLGQQGMPWDLMAWGFTFAEREHTGYMLKPAVQLQQEASAVLAQGGGFQIYYMPSREGYIEDSTIEVMRKAAVFCREREAYCHHSETVPQTGVVYSKTSVYRTASNLFRFDDAFQAANGWLDLLLDSQYSADSIPDWKLSSVASRYGVLVLPEFEAVPDETLQTLRSYAEQGGIVVVSGAVNTARWLGVAQAGTMQGAFVFGSEVMASMGGTWLDVAPEHGLETIETRYATRNRAQPGLPAALAVKAGRGEVVLVPGPVGDVYWHAHAAPVRDFARRLIRPRFRPLVEVDGPPTLEVVLRKKNGKLYVHVLNLTAMQTNTHYAVTDFIPPVGPVRVRFNGKPPKSVRLLPENRELRPPYVIERLELMETLEVG